MVEALAPGHAERGLEVLLGDNRVVDAGEDRAGLFRLAGSGRDGNHQGSCSEQSPRADLG